MLSAVGHALYSIVPTMPARHEENNPKLKPQYLQNYPILPKTSTIPNSPVLYSINGNKTNQWAHPLIFRNMV